MPTRAETSSPIFPQETSGRNALTVDVEDYFQVSGFEDVIPRASWDTFESRVERNTDRLLEILAEAGVTATFFVLGWTAERHPALVRRIHAAGHELACHSYAHRLVYRCTAKEFREDTHRAKCLVEDLSAQPIIGYRAPSFSITRKSLWALEILAEEGFAYDSSIFPILRDRYGIPSAPRYPYRILLGDYRASALDPVNPVALLGGKAAGRRPMPVGGCRLPATGDDAAQQLDAAADSEDSILEIPPSTIRLLGVTLPIGGGGYLRLFRESLFHRALRHIIELERKPAVLYIHPWELDPDQPRLRGGAWVSRFRQYVHLDQAEGKLRNLLVRWRFAPIRDLLDSLRDISRVRVSQISARGTARHSNGDEWAVSAVVPRRLEPWEPK